MPPPPAKCTYYSRNASDFVEAQLVSRALRCALSERELGRPWFLARPGQDRCSARSTSIPCTSTSREPISPTGLGAFFLPFLFLLIAIYVTVLIYGVYVMRSVIEEKSSRVVEVLLGQRHTRCN